MGKTIIVSNRLPLSAETKNGEMVFNPSSGGLATGLGCIFSEKDNIWIGWPGLDIPEVERQAQTMAQLKEKKDVPRVPRSPTHRRFL